MENKIKYIWIVMFFICVWSLFFEKKKEPTPEERHFQYIAGLYTKGFREWKYASEKDKIEFCKQLADYSNLKRLRYYSSKAESPNELYEKIENYYNRANQNDRERTIGWISGVDIEPKKWYREP